MKNIVISGDEPFCALRFTLIQSDHGWLQTLSVDDKDWTLETIMALLLANTEYGLTVDDDKQPMFEQFGDW